MILFAESFNKVLYFDRPDIIINIAVYFVYAWLTSLKNELKVDLSKGIVYLV